MRVPQTTGYLGWLVFTYENNTPVCIFLSTQECTKVQCIADERICGDTFLRVEKVGDNQFVVSDIWMYNSNCVFACSNFEQRYNWLKLFLKTFIQTVEGTAKLIHKSEASGFPIRGYEEHPYEIGKPGYFIEKEDDSEVLEVTRLPIPDCYEISGNKGYLLVPDIKTSFYLRSKGELFKCKCIQQDDEFWKVVENIPELEVNAS